MKQHFSAWKETNLRPYSPQSKHRVPLPSLLSILINLHEGYWVELLNEQAGVQVGVTALTGGEPPGWRSSAQGAVPGVEPAVRAAAVLAQLPGCCGRGSWRGAASGCKSQRPAGAAAAAARQRRAGHAAGSGGSSCKPAAPSGGTCGNCSRSCSSASGNRSASFPNSAWLSKINLALSVHCYLFCQTWWGCRCSFFSCLLCKHREEEAGPEESWSLLVFYFSLLGIIRVSVFAICLHMQFLYFPLVCW